MAVQWGDVPTWVGSVGTAGALLIAMWLLKKEVNDRRQRDSEARAAQAAQVAAWTSGRVVRADPYPEMLVRIRNGSTMPIFTVNFEFSQGVRGTFVRYILAMGPEETREFRILLPSYPKGETIAPSLTFADAAGRRWFRDGNGKLRELAERELVIFNEGPGSYGSIEDHPTLHLPLDEIENGGRIVP